MNESRAINSCQFHNYWHPSLISIHKMCSFQKGLNECSLFGVFSDQTCVLKKYWHPVIAINISLISPFCPLFLNTTGVLLYMYPVCDTLWYRSLCALCVLVRTPRVETRPSLTWPWIAGFAGSSIQLSIAATFLPPAWPCPALASATTPPVPSWTM